MIRTIENNYIKSIKSAVEETCAFNFGYPTKFNYPFCFLEVAESGGMKTKLDYGEIQVFLLNVWTKTLKENTDLKENLINSLQVIEVEGFSTITVSCRTIRTIQEEDKSYRSVIELTIRAFNN